MPVTEDVHAPPSGVQSNELLLQRMGVCAFWPEFGPLRLEEGSPSHSCDVLGLRAHRQSRPLLDHSGCLRIFISMPLQANHDVVGGAGVGVAGA